MLSTGDFMKRTKIDRYLLAAMGCTQIIPQTPSKETSMTTYSFQPLSPAHRSANHYLDTWIKTIIIEKSNEVIKCKEKRILGMKRRRIQTDSKLKLKAIPGVELFEVICPKDLENSEYRIRVVPSSSNPVHVVPQGMILFVQGEK